MKHVQKLTKNKLSQKEISYEGFIKAQNTCPLCNSRLDIRAISYLENHTLREEATCPQCKLLARVKDHKMH